MTYHVPVLLKEAIEALNIKQNGIYVDCTFGGGGHAAEILKKLGADGRLIAFDQDADARANLPQDRRVTFVPHNFRHLHRFLRLHKINGVDGIIADLGVSSHQFDEAERGFSTRFDGSLDMRMDRRQELTAQSIVNTYTEQRLHKIFEQYGEVTNSKTLARTIVEARQVSPIKNTIDLKNALHDIVKGNPAKYFAQVFQALRIEVNDEVGALKEMLLQIPGVMNTGARVAIITFHSLEDRIVKQFFKEGNFEGPDPQDVYGSRSDVSRLRILTKKPIVPQEDERKLNPRSRSARLRAAEKI